MKILAEVYAFVSKFIAKEFVFALIQIVASVPLGLLLLWMLARFFPDSVYDILNEEVLSATELYLAMYVLALALIYLARITLTMVKTAFKKEEAS